MEAGPRGLASPAIFMALGVPEVVPLAGLTVWGVAEAPWLRFEGNTLAWRMRWESATVTGGMLARRVPGAGANSLPEPGAAVPGASLAASRRTGSLAVGRSAAG